MAAQTDKRPEILIVGTDHPANRGHDVYNVQVDDLLLPERRQEIAEVIEALKKFRPTKIAIEADIDSDTVAEDSSDYLAGKYTRQLPNDAPMLNLLGLRHEGYDCSVMTAAC